ncbi:MAG: hypothetical protein HN576_12075, partial [Bacteriovoracaceae bacterium]|nr:hypothetical protein [Bacteriovoracaceae bacterium]
MNYLNQGFGMRTYLLVLILLTSSCLNEVIVLEKRDQGNSAESAGAAVDPVSSPFVSVWATTGTN